MSKLSKYSVIFFIIFCLVWIVCLTSKAEAKHNYRDTDGWVKEEYVCGIKDHPNSLATSFARSVKPGVKYFPGGYYYNINTKKVYVESGGYYRQPGGIDRSIVYDICKLKDAGPTDWKKIKAHERGHAEGWAHGEGSPSINPSYDTRYRLCRC